MKTTDRPSVKCPLCGADGEIAHHDVRASLVYSCSACLHEWQIDPNDEPLDVDLLAGERAPSKQPRKL